MYFGVWNPFSNEYFQSTQNILVNGHKCINKTIQLHSQHNLSLPQRTLRLRDSGVAINFIFGGALFTI